MRPEAELTELVAAPWHRYTLRVGLPGEVTKSLIPSRALLDRARTSPSASLSVLLALRSEVAQQQARPATERSREVRVQTRAWRNCPVCHEPILGTDLVVVRRARFLHRRCDPQTGR